MRALAKAAILLFAGALALAGCGADTPKFKSSDITGAGFGRDFALSDHAGKPRVLADFRGKAVVLFAEALKQLGPDAERVQVLFVTVDPERDTAELLSSYVTAFGPSFVGLRGDADATARTAKEFKVLYEKRPGRTPESYTVDHSAGTFVFDPQGRLRLYVGNGQVADVFAHDIRELLRTSG